MTWEKAWEEARTPWDAGESAPALVDWVASGKAPRGRVLVPGCGSGYDVVTLAAPERDMTGLDLSPIAAKRFEELRERAGVPSARARVLVASFFEHEPFEPYDAIFDYTFLCALDPEQRPRWSQRVAELVRTGGELITLIFPVSGGSPDQGPPYPQDPEAVRELLGSRWRNELLEPVERSHAGRAGLEWLARWRKL